MNRIYRTLWSAATQSWQAVPETAKSAGKKSKSSAGGVIASVALGFSLNGVAHAQAPPALPPAINQLPTGGTVARGTATISQTATAQAAAMVVNQSSQRAVINWNTFNLGSAASINFVQPNAQAVALNRVNDSNPSQIFGRITANGQVFLTNANGVYFSPTSSVDVGALVATTHSITDDNFMSGNYVFERNGATGKIVNEGNITAALGGYVALLAPEVQNAGLVVATAGTVVMAAGEMITLTIDGAGSLGGITATPSAIASLVENKLAVLAPDGQIILSAVALNKLQAGVVKNSGNLEANSLVNKGGKIFLEGDEIVMDRNSRIEAKGRTGGGVVLVGGDWQGSGDVRQATKVTMEAGATIDASATDNGDGGKVVLWSDVHNADSVTQVNGSIRAEAGSNGGDGGKVETSGHALNVNDIYVSTQAKNGALGRWLIDPYDFTVAASGGDITGASLSTMLENNSITIQANSASSSSNTSTTKYGSAGTAGNINIKDTVTWSANTALTLAATNNIYISSSIIASGDSAGLNVFYGGSSATTAPTAGTYYQYDLTTPGHSYISMTGNSASLKIANNSYTLIKSIADIPNINATGVYALGQSLISPSTYSTAVYTGNFKGIFDGLGNSISGIQLTNQTPGQSSNCSANCYIGFFSQASDGAQIKNLQINETITISGPSSGNVTYTNYAVGGLVGLVSNSTGNSSKSVFSGNGVTLVQNTQSVSTLTINGYWGGGVIGKFYDPSTAPVFAQVSQTYASVNINNSSVSNITNSSVGGIVGEASASTTGSATSGSGSGNVDISTAYVSGSIKVKQTGGYYGVGGVIGQDYGPGMKITNAYTYFSSGSLVSLSSTGTQNGSVGGLYGWYQAASPGTFQVTNSYSTFAGTNSSSSNVYYGVSLSGNTALLTGFNNSIWQLQNGAVVLTNLPLPSAAPGAPIYVLETLTTGTYGNLSFSYSLVDVNKNAVTLGSGTYANLSISGQATYNITNTSSVGNYNVKYATGLILGGTAASGFSLYAYPNSYSITPAVLTVNNTSVANKTYDGTDVATLTGGQLQGVMNGDSVSLTQVGTFAHTSAGKWAITAADTLGGTAATLSNYTLIQPSGLTAEIYKANLYSISASKIYDGLATVSANQITSIAGVNGETFTASSGTANISDKNVATASKALTDISGLILTSSNGGLVSNYYLDNAHLPAAGLQNSVTISKANLALTAGSDSKTYDGTTSSTVSVISTGKAASDTVVATQVFTDKNVLGTGGSTLQIASGYTIKDALNADMSGNYNVTTPTASGTISKATLTLAATSDSKTYDGTTNSSVGVSVSGKAAPDTVVATQKFTDKNVLGAGNSTLQITPGYTIKDSSNVDMSGNYVINVSASAAGTITPATASIAAAKPYDGLATVTAAQVTVNGVNGETLNYSGTAQLQSANVRDNASNYVSGLTALVDNGSVLAANYMLPSQTTSSARNAVTISKANATVTAGSNTTTYSGVAQTINGFTATGLVNGETESVLTGVTVSATGTNAGTYTSTASGTDGNYNLSFVTGALTINKANATVTAGSATTTYTGLAQSVSGFTATGLVNGESTTVLTGVITSGGTGTNVGTYTSTASGNATNYNLTFVPGALTINKAHLTVTANSASKTYGDANPVLSTTVSGFVNNETAAVLTGAGTATTTATASTGAGTATITAGVGTLSASNYDFTNLVDGTLTINKAHLTVTANNASKTYGDLNPTLSATVSGFVNSETLGTSGVTGTGAATTTATALTGAGTATITAGAGTLSAANYDFTNLVNGTLTINKAHLTVKANDASKTYGDLNPSLSTTVIGFVNNETAAVLTGAGTATTTATALTGAGTATITAGAGTLSAANYDFTNLVDGTLTINKAHLTVTANNASKTYGDLNPTLSTTVSGFVNGETTAVLTGAGVATTTATALTGAGTATITAGAGTLSAANYDFTNLVNGTLTINKAHLTVTANNASKTYGDTNPTLSTTVSGFVNSETLGTSGVSGAGAATTTATALTGAGTATITAGAGTLSAANYDFTNLVNGTLTINKANATVTANSGSVTYTGLAQSISGFSATGLVNGEATTVLAGVSTGGGTGTNAGTYASTASGTDSNYNLTFVPGALTINKAHLTVTANNASKTYGDANPALNTTVSGFVNGETTAVLTGAGTATTTATALTGAGTATITAGTGTLSAANYDFTNLVNGTLTINKANATVTANSGSVTYNGLSQSISGFSATGLVNSETTAVLTGVSTSGGTGTNAGIYTHTASGLDNNYNLTFVNGALTIGKANATVTANSGATTYNGATQSVSGFTATGLVNSEALSVLTGVSTSGGTGINAGSYTHTASGTDNNYNLTFVNGAYTINKAPLNMSLASQTKVYDGTTNATLANGSLSLTGFVSGEGATVSQTQGSYNSANVLNATTVTASLAAGNYTANNGTLLSNYVLPTTASGTGSITPARLSASGTKTYDGLVAFDGTGLTVSGVNGETFTATGSGTMGSKNVQANQTLTSVAGLSLSGNNGALASNYVALATSDTQVSVTPLAVNLNAPAASKTYDSTTLYQVSAADLATLSSQLVGNDRVTAADVVYANKDAGTGKRVSLNSVAISDDNGGNNYIVGKLDVTTGVINKAPLTVSVVNDARFINQTDATGFAGVVYNGLVGGETASVLTAGSITRSNPSVNGAGQYNGVLQASGWQSGNYNISYNAGDYTIVGAHTLLVRVPTVSTTYGTAATYTPTAQYLDSNNNTIMTLTPAMTGNALSVNDGVGGTASFAITATSATLSSSGNVQAGGYNLQASNVVKAGSNFQNLVMTGGLTVTPKVLNSNLGVQSITKVYDGSASISNLGLSFNQPLAGVVSGDTVSLVGSGSFDDRHVATNKTVNLSLGLLGSDAANYALATSSLSSNTGSITQLASVTYTGATNGNWSDFSNWAGGAMPDRNNVAQVVVPTGKTVVYNSDQVGTVGSTLAVNGAIRFTSSNAFTLANTVSGTGDLQQRGNGMLTVSGTNSNFSGNLDIGTYQATLNNAQALGSAGHVVSNGGQLSVASGVTLAALHVDGALTVDTAIKTTGDQVYNGALTFLSSGTAQAPNFASNTGNVDFMSTVSAGSGSMTAQRSLAVSAPNGSVLINDQVGRSVKNFDLATYLSTGLSDTNPYALTVTAPIIKLFGDVTTFDSQTYDGAVRVGSNGQNGHTRLLVSIDPSITFKGTVDDADPTGKVNGLDVRAISLAALTANSPVPTITFDGNVGSTSPLASLRLAAGTQSTAPGAMVTDIKTDDTSRRDTNYKGDIVLKGDLKVDAAPEMIAEQLLVPNGTSTLTWYTGTPDFKLRLPTLGSNSVLPANLQLVQWGQSGNAGSSSNNNSNSNTNTASNNTEAGRQWLMAHDTLEHATQVRSNETNTKVMETPLNHGVADVQVGDEATTLPIVARSTSSPVELQTMNASNSGPFVQVREFAPITLQAQKPFVYELPSDTFVHSRENEYIKLSATLSNGANLPRWVKFSFKNRTFSGEAPKHVKSLDVKVTATDRQGKRASTRIRLVFSNGSGS